MSYHIPSYYKQERAPVSALIPRGNHSVLDIGCAAGFFGKTLKNNNQAKIVYGIEGFKAAACEASNHVDLVEHADLNSLSFEELDIKWKGKRFNYIILTDVLEHLVDPWAVLSSCTKLLAVDGKVIISVPNVRHWSVIAPLIFNGKWEYTESGIMDKTHLRFFTKVTALELIHRSHLNLISISYLMGKKSKLLSNLTANITREFLATQFLIQAELKR